MDKKTLIRLASIIADVPNHEERIHDTEYAYTLTRCAGMLREYHATLCIAARLEMLAVDAMPPVHFIVSDISDGGLRVPLVMCQADEWALLKYVRGLLQASPIYQIEITGEREIVLWSFVYDTSVRTSSLVVFDSSVETVRKAS